MSGTLARAAAALSFGSAVYAQQAGTLTAETHPKLSVSTCSAGGTCTSQTQSIVLDANWRWLHSTSGSTNCYTGNTWNTQLCPDATTCAANCALDGADYTGTYGITASGNSLSLQLKTGSNVGSRVYLMDSTDTKYQMFDLRNQEFTFTVDVSKLGCGLNGALYFVQMPADGGVSEYPGNKAGTKYGTGYCDSQCPQDLKFIAGSANIDWTPSANSANSGTGSVGSCCNEMDIWEANSISNAVTPHVCNENAPCTDATDCANYCDKAGCDFNPYRMGNTTFYGPSETIDTTKPITVVTQFITTDGTATGDLSEIRRLYVQNGKVYAQPQSDIAGVTGNSITDSFCNAQKTTFGDTNYFEANGGLKAMGDAFAKGMVLVMSLWDDYAVDMLWLDAPYPTTAPTTNPGVVRGTCSTSSGKPADVESQSPGSTVIYSNIKTGPIGSTYSGTLQPGGSGGSSGGSSSSSAAPPPKSSSTSAAPPPSSKTTTTTSKAAAPTTTTTTTKAATPTGGQTAAHYGQCGGQGWTGPTVCASPYTCKASNQYYSQCL